MYSKTLIICTAMLAVTMALPASDKTGSENDLMASIYNDCQKKESLSCIKYKVFSFVDKMLADKEDITLSEGITVVKTMNMEEGAPRSIESNDLETILFDRIGRFLRTHTIKVDLKGTDILGAIESAGRSLTVDDSSDTDVEGRGKKKKAKMIAPIILAMAMKAAALFKIGMGLIALIAGKALLIGKIALVISTIIGLKKLFSGQKHVTYEVVQHPHHSSHPVSHDDGGHGGGYGGGSSGGDFGGYSGGGSSGGHGGWSRSFAQEMAYSAQKPQAPATS